MIEMLPVIQINRLILRKCSNREAVQKHHSNKTQRQKEYKEIRD